MRPLLVFLVLLPIASNAAAPADGRLGYLTRQLEKGTDPRVRAQAALLLGASKEASAVKPLCVALEDPVEVVRSAAARGLEKLAQPSGADCLKRRVAKETGDVQAAVQHALAALSGAAAVEASEPPAAPELYIALSPLVDKSASLGGDLMRLTEDRLKARLARMGGVFAPASETKAAARAVLKAKKLKGYLLRIELEKTSTGGLKLNIVCFTYPDRSLLGEVNVKASGGKPADLIQALAPRAVEEAAQTFDWSS